MLLKNAVLARGLSLAVSLTLAAAAAEARTPPGDGGGGGGGSVTVGCADSVLSGNAGFVKCIGPIGQSTNAALFNPNGQAAELTALSASFGGTWAWQGKSDDAGFGPFSVNPVGKTSLTFDAAVKGLFIVAVKGGPDASFYEFNGGTAGITTLNFDTRGIVTGSGAPGPTLSHLGLYTSVATVPEPQTCALMLAGLGVVCTVGRRCKARG